MNRIYNWQQRVKYFEEVRKRGLEAKVRQALIRERNFIGYTGMPCLLPGVYQSTSKPYLITEVSFLELFPGIAHKEAIWHVIEVRLPLSMLPLSPQTET